MSSPQGIDSVGSIGNESHTSDEAILLVPRPVNSNAAITSRALTRTARDQTGVNAGSDSGSANTSAAQENPDGYVPGVSMQVLASRSGFTQPQLADAEPPPNSPVLSRSQDTPYVGDDPVSMEWLVARNAHFDVILQDYEAQLAAARADYGGVGWTLRPVVDSDGDPRRTLIGVRTPSGEVLPMRLTGYSRDGDPFYSLPTGIALDERDRPTNGYTYEYETQTTGSFSESAFRDWYLAQPNAEMQALATHYGLSGTAQMLEQFPDMLDIIVAPDRQENAGPGLNGQAMVPSDQLAMLDIVLLDPDVQAIIAADTEPVPTPDNAVERAQFYLYGQARYDEMVRYDRAMASVRGDYLSALGAARRDPDSIGWQTRTVNQPSYSDRRDDDSYTVTEFSVDQFTAWYLTQDTASTRLFADFYGQTSTRQTGTTGRDGEVAVYTSTFAAAGWSMTNGQMSHDDVRNIVLSSPPRLHDAQAVYFVPGAGWVTPDGNIKRSRNWFSDLIKVAIVGVLTYVTAGAAAGFAAGAFGAGTATAAVAGAAITGAASSVYSSAVYGGFSWDNVLRGAFAGALTAGLSQLRLAQSLSQSTAGAIGTQAVIQGTVTEIMGGDFADGALAGLASGVANEMLRSMNASIDASSLSDAEKMVARQSARILTTAVRVAHTDGHPGQAFAEALVTSIVQSAAHDAYLEAYDAGEALGAYLLGDPPEVAPGTSVALSGDDDDTSVTRMDDGSIVMQQGDDMVVYRILENGDIGLFDDDGNLLLTYQNPDAARPYATNGGTVAQPGGWSVGNTTILGNADDISQIFRQYGSQGLRALRALGNGTFVVLRGAAATVGTVGGAAVGVTLIAIATPSNLFQSGEIAYEGETHRFVRPHSMLSGSFEVRNADGDWEVVPGRENVLLEQLSERELELLQAPMGGGPSTPVAPDSTPPLEQADDLGGTPGFDADENAGEPTVLPGADPESNRITFDDLIMTSRSDLLGADLIVNGESKPHDTYQAHHIVPTGDSRSAHLVRLLISAGINIDGQTNGIWLPGNSRSPDVDGSTRHNQTQRDSYFDYLNDQFAGASVAEVPAILAGIKQDLASGRYFPTKNEI